MDVNGFTSSFYVALMVPDCVPFKKPQEETEDWDQFVAAIPEEDITAFVQKKMEQSQKYEEQRLE
jgi:hypothetical protein